MRYSFTATRDVDADSPHVIQTRLMELVDVTAIYTGGAPGGDQLIAELALTLFPNALHRLILPAKKWIDEPFIERWLDRVGDVSSVQWTELHPLKRNAVLLDKGRDALEAFPRTSDEERRSGTWATIRLAQRRGTPPVTITALRR